MSTTTEGASENLTDYFRERYDYLRLYLVKTEGGGYDIMLRIDGTYSATAVDMEQQLHYERTRLVSAMERSEVDPMYAKTGSREWMRRQIAQLRREIVDPTGLDWTAGELVASGQCSGNCLIAGSPVSDCDCRCRGDWHGALANMLVSPPKEYL